MTVKSVTHGGIKAKNRDSLIADLTRYLEEYTHLLKGDAPMLSIEPPCGNVVNYQSLKDIPNRSVKCPCGNKDHWIIKYSEE
jgi:hypothetical protein